MQDSPENRFDFILRLGHNQRRLLKQSQRHWERILCLGEECIFNVPFRFTFATVPLIRVSDFVVKTSTERKLAEYYCRKFKFVKESFFFVVVPCTACSWWTWYIIHLKLWKWIYIYQNGMWIQQQYFAGGEGYDRVRWIPWKYKSITVRKSRSKGESWNFF